MIDLILWFRVQRIVYPKRWPSDNPPFSREVSSPKRKPASWLYWTLFSNQQLQREVFPQ